MSSELHPVEAFSLPGDEGPVDHSLQLPPGLGLLETGQDSMSYSRILRNLFYSITSRLKRQFLASSLDLDS